MTNKEIFNSQWLRLKEEMVEKMNRALAQGHMLPNRDLNKLYKGKLLRWESYGNPEGRWLEDQEEAERKAFLNKLHSVSLEEIPEEDFQTKAPVTVGAIGGGVAAVIAIALNVLGVMGWLLGAVCILAGFGIGFFVANGKRKHEIQTHNERMKKQYISQIEKAGAELAEFWR